MPSFSVYWLIGGAIGGWCGSVPISVIIWWIIHHGGPPPPPDPWWKISFAGLVCGLIAATAILSFTGEAVTSASLTASVVIGFAAGTIGGGMAARGSLPRQ